MSTCTVCHGYGHYLIGRDPDLEDLCMCEAGDALRSPGELTLKRLFEAFKGIETP